MIGGADPLLGPLQDVADIKLFTHLMILFDAMLKHQSQTGVTHSPFPLSRPFWKAQSMAVGHAQT